MPKPNVDIVQGAFEAKRLTIVACEHGHIFIRLHDRAGKMFAFACFDKAIGVEAMGQIERAITGPGFTCESVH